MSQVTTKSNGLRNAVRTSLFLLSSGLFLQTGHAQTTLNNSEAKAQEIWQTAQTQFYNGNPAACYKNLGLLSDVLLGDVTYDRLLGLCAQGSGRFDQALLAYNRILSQQPENADIRLERARVYFNLEIYPQARSEFEWLLTKQPPASARSVIDQYLYLLERKQPKLKQYTSLKISTTLGYDDNVNSAPVLDQFLGFVLNDDSKATDSTYAGLQLSVDHLKVLSHKSGLKLSLSLGTKHYPDAGFINQDLVTAGIGYVQGVANGTRGVDVLVYEQYVDGDFNSRGNILRAYYKHNMNEKISVMPYVKTGAFRFSDKLVTKNINQYVYGAALAYKKSFQSKDTFGLDYSFTHDYPVYQDSNYEVDIYSLKLNNQHKFNDTFSVNTVLQYSVFNYDKAFFKLSFPEPRDDELLSVQTRFDWDITKNLEFTPTLGYKDYDSSVDVFKYQRWFAELGLNYQFKW